MHVGNFSIFHPPCSSGLISLSLLPPQIVSITVCFPLLLDFCFLLEVDLLRTSHAAVLRSSGVFHVCQCVNKKRDIKKESMSKEIWRSSEEERRTWCLQRVLGCSLALRCLEEGCWRMSSVSLRRCFLFLSSFSGKVKLLCLSDSAETLSLRIQLDYSGQMMKINQNISALGERAPRSHRFTVIA